MFEEMSEHFGDTLGELFSQLEVWIFIGLIGVFIAIPLLAPEEIVQIFWEFVKLTWSFWIFFPLFFLLKDTYLFVMKEAFKKDKMTSDKNVMLEIFVPRALEKGPEGMEQILLTMHGLVFAPGDIHKIWLEGETQLWYSLEMVSFAGEVHLYLRTPKQHRNVVEALFFSHYPDAEVVEVPDYVDNFPETTADLYAEEKNIWGREMILAKESLFPLKTYHEFTGGAEDKKGSMDPMSAFFEILGKLKAGEIGCIQFLVQPAPRDWAKKWSKKLEELRTPKLTGEKGDKVPLESTKEGTDLVNAVAKNFAKPAFNTLIRVMYMGATVDFKARSNFMKYGSAGAFNQYTTPSLNGIKANSATETKTDPWDWPHIFNAKRLEMRRQHMLWKYRTRVLPPQTLLEKIYTSHLLCLNVHSKMFELSIEAIATLFHPPTAAVLTAPHMRRIESKKASLPAGLAIFGEEENLEKFGGV